MTNAEVWHDVRGYEGWYEVSDRGRVRSVPRTIVFSDGRERFYFGQILAQYTDDYGYPKVTLKRNSEDNRVHVHFLVAESFLGRRPRGKQVRHKDGNPKRPFAKNLCYGTSQQNHADALRHDTRLYGTRIKTSKFSSTVIARIKKLRGVATAQAIADRVGSSPSHVCNVQLGRRRIYHGIKRDG